MSLDMRFDSIKDFSPDRVAENVPELKKLLDIRNALAALKGPLGNMRQFRKQLEDTLQDEELVAKFMDVVSTDDAGAAPSAAGETSDADASDAPIDGTDSPGDA